MAGQSRHSVNDMVGPAVVNPCAVNVAISWVGTLDKDPCGHGCASFEEQKANATGYIFLYLGVGRVTVVPLTGVAGGQHRGFAHLYKVPNGINIGTCGLSYGSLHTAVVSRLPGNNT